MLRPTWRHRNGFPIEQDGQGAKNEAAGNRKESRSRSGNFEVKQEQSEQAGADQCRQHV